MAFTIAVPAVRGRSAQLVACNVDDEALALREAERFLGYQIVGLPYVVQEFRASELNGLDFRDDTCVLLTEAEEH